MNKKRNKGFTLIELLAVIVILAIIALIATPIILGVIEDSKKKAFENTAYGLIESAQKTIARAQLEKPNISGGSYTFTDGVVAGTPTLEFTGETPKSGNVSVTSDGKTEIAIWNGKYCAIKGKEASKVTFKKDATADNCKLTGSVTGYQDPILNGADPEVSNGMIPVLIAGDGTVTKANTGSKWYDYTAKEWANIVLVRSDVRDTYKVGDTIDQAKILAYFVWIPRYKYQLFNVTATPGSPEEIQIVFENKDTAKTLGTAKGEWRTHPGFTFGTEELNGIWVGKFETTGTASNPTVLPNVTSLTNQTVATFFTTSQLLNTGTYGLTSTNDSHMMKNSEWGAVSYLVNSQYGRYNSDGTCIAAGCEIWINNVNTGYGNGTVVSGQPQWGPAITGCAGSSVSASVTNNMTACPSGYDYKTKGVNASTTGNITGIYDMSGGAWERVMGNFDETVSSSGIGFDKIDSKYYDLYSSTTSTTACNGGICYGHALSETQGWNRDYATFVSTAYPWFRRGGYHYDGVFAGAFSFNYTTGGADTHFGSRVVFRG